MIASVHTLRADTDITALAESFRILEERSPDGFMALRAVRDANGQLEDFVYVYVNPAAERLIGRKDALSRGKRLYQLAPQSRARFFESQKKLLETQVPTQVDLEYHNEFGGGWYRTVNLPYGDGFVTRFQSIDAQKAAEQRMQESHAELVAVLENTHDGFCTLDLDWRFTFANGRAEKLLRQARTALLGQCLWDVFPDLAGSATQRSFFEAQQLKVSRAITVTLEKLGRSFEVRVCPTPKGMSCFWHDLTAQNAAEAQVRENERRLRTLSDAIPQMIWSAEPSGELDYFNQRWFEFTGSSLEALRGYGWKSILHPEDVPAVTDRWMEALQGRDSFEVECRLRRRDGEFLWYLARGRTLKDPSGKTVKWFGTCTEIHDQKTAEARDRLLSTIIEQSSDSIRILGLDGSVSYANPAALALVGAASFSELVEKVQRGERFAPEDEARVETEMKPSLAATGRWEGELRLGSFHGGEPIPVQQTLFTLRERGNGKPIGFASVARDLRAIKREQDRYRSLVTASAQVVFTLGPEGNLLEPSAAFSELSGQAPAASLGRGWRESFHPADRAAMNRAWRDAVVRRGLCEVEARLVRADGRLIWVSLRAVPVETLSGKSATEWVGTLTDIDDKRRLTEEREALLTREREARRAAERAVEERTRELSVARDQLMQTEQLATVGQLAAGVGHEINNPLAVVSANLEHVSKELESRLEKLGPEVRAELADVREALAEARGGAARIRNIVKDLRTFGRSDEGATRVTSVTEPLELALGISHHELRARAVLVRSDGPTPLVHVNPGELGQVFVNLLANAAQSLPEHPAEKGTVTVRTRTDLNGWAVVEVIDTGCGIPAEHLSRVFDPFFSTRPVGRGKGLGLSICHGIVRNLGGRIEVASRPGQGSTFRVVLPPAAREETTVTAPQTLEEPRRRPRVLVIDDEASVVATLRRILGQRFDVVGIQSGREALDLLATDDAFDLMLCDLVMPDLTGMDIYDQVTLHHPELLPRFVFVTGGGTTLRAREFLAHVPGPRVDKPFLPDQILKIAEQLIKTPGVINV